MNPDHIRELFAAFRPVDVRRMFSGAGIFAEGLMFGLVVDEVVYLKVGEENAADFEREDMPPFQYRAKGGRRAVMSYRRMPERLYDDPEELAQWAAKALRVATRKAPPKARSKAKTKPVRKKAGGKPR
jgi:DNA transformation protein